MIHKQEKNYIKNIKAHHNQPKRPATMLNAQMNTALLHRCSYTSKYNVKTRFTCIWDYDLHLENSLSMVVWHIWYIQYIQMMHDAPI